MIRSRTEGKSSVQDTAEARSDLLRLVNKLEKFAREPDLKVSRFAFDALVVVFRRVLAWLNMNALLPDASLGLLSRHLSESDAWERYNRGEHIAAWSGVELVRHYKQIARSTPRFQNNGIRFSSQSVALPSWLRPAVLQGEAALNRLDSLPAFGGSGVRDLEAWRKFVRHRLLTQTDFIKEFEMLFPQRRKKLDGVIAARLRYAWQAVHAGGNVILPE